MSEENKKNTESSSQKENKKSMTSLKINNNPLHNLYREKTNMQAKLEQIRNPEAIKAVISLNEKLKNSCNLLSAVDSEIRQKLFQNYSKIQQQVNKVLAAPHVMQETIAAYKRMGDALCNAALSSTVIDYQKNIQEAINAEQEFSNSSSVEENEEDNVLRHDLKELKETAEKIKKNEPEEQEAFRELRKKTELKADEIAFSKIQQDTSDINATLSMFLAKFDENAGKLLNASQLTQKNIEKLVDKAKENNDKIAEQVRTAEKNGNTVNELLTASQNNFKASKVDAKKNTNLSYVAIGIAFVGVIVQIGLAIFDYCTDNHEKIIEILQNKSFCSPKIHIEKSSNVKVALEKGTIVSQDDVKLMQKTNRLQADLKKAQDTLSGLEKKYNAATAGFALEKQKLYAEIAALKKQIEELEIALRKNFLSSGKEQGNRK